MTMMLLLPKKKMMMVMMMMMILQQCCFDLITSAEKNQHPATNNTCGSWTTTHVLRELVEPALDEEVVVVRTLPNVRTGRILSLIHI